MDQDDNLKNSKLKTGSRWLWLPLGFAAVVVIAMGPEVLGYRLGLTGRLHPALVPAALIGLLLIAGLAITRGSVMKQSEFSQLASQDALCDDQWPDIPPLTILASVIAIGIIAIGTHYLGVPLTVFVAVIVCLTHSRTLSRVRRIVIAAGLAFLVTVIFIVVLRLPLPIGPGGRFW